MRKVDADAATREPERPPRTTEEVVFRYLRDNRAPRVGEVAFLLLAGGPTWYVRWPNGSLRWETEAALRARGATIPAHPLLRPVVDPVTGEQL